MSISEAILDRTFLHFYECEEMIELPDSSLPHYYYPGACTEGGRDGMLVRIRAQQAVQWFGTFAFGQVTPEGISGIFTTPDPDHVCVVARGEGYFVSSKVPTDWKSVTAVPIIDVRPVRKHEIIVFATFTDLVAYGSTKVRWRTKRLAWDGLAITKITEDYIKGKFWDIRSEAMATFTVDLATGAHRGGIQELSGDGSDDRG